MNKLTETNTVVTHNFLFYLKFIAYKFLTVFSPSTYPSKLIYVCIPFVQILDQNKQ